MMQAFNIGGEASPVLGVDLDLVVFDSGFWTFAERDRETSVWKFVR